LRGAYMLDTKMNLKIELGFAERMERTAAKTIQIPFVFIGIRMDLSNVYTDF
jgi:hypothetical protein